MRRPQQPQAVINCKLRAIGVEPSQARHHSHVTIRTLLRIAEWAASQVDRGPAQLPELDRMSTRTAACA